ncbi:hypothetical protein [Billgrantia sp. C5P2]|uniref:hypothetical protein n=1 Tax=Billgrantia sp. C5P2 TaxID=3436239 RepID=UPI003DA37BC2
MDKEMQLDLFGENISENSRFISDCGASLNNGGNGFQQQRAKIFLFDPAMRKDKEHYEYERKLVEKILNKTKLF